MGWEGIGENRIGFHQIVHHEICTYEQTEHENIGTRHDLSYNLEMHRELTKLDFMLII